MGEDYPKRLGSDLLEWNGVEPRLVASVVSRARGGSPTVLVVEGDPGLGKTALLADLVEKAAGFQVLRADGVENDRTPFTLLAQWGVDPARPVDGGESSTRVAAQALRDRLDALAVVGPVLLVADDLHWADPESVDAVLWLMRRTVGDRLLVAVGTRPLPLESHTGWQRWIADRDVVFRVVLAPLSLGQVARHARRKWPNLSDEVARRLYEHTSGNPLFLKIVLAENDLPTLSTTGLLPAPAAFARSIAVQTAELSDAALTLLRAACILGGAWAPLSLVAVVAGIGDPAVHAEELSGSKLVELRPVDGPVQLRPSHALVRASVYQQTPLPQLRLLHARAATTVASRASALQHQVAAADQYDDSLADELASFAADLYSQRSFRLAAQYWRWASELTSAPALREQRWLESVYVLVLSHDFGAVDGELEDVREANDAVGRALVLGVNEIWRRRYRAGVDVLEPIAAAQVLATDPRARYRVEVLLAWARLCLGQPTDVIAGGVTRAAGTGVHDAGLVGQELMTSSLMSIRQLGIDAVLQQLSALPVAAHAPLSATGALALRGTLRATMGHTLEAAEDLAEATRRFTDRVTDLGRGSFLAQLGFVQWLRGDWGPSRMSFRQALEMGGQFVHPMTVTWVPLVDIAQGRFAEADAVLAQTRQLLTQAPWQEACMQFLTTLIARVHAGGSPTEQSSVLAELRGTPFEITDITRASPTLLLNYVPALIWSGRLDEAADAVSGLGQFEPAAPWAPAVRAWFEGLIREARGDRTGALALLESALTKELDLPLYRAHLLADHARLARLLGRPGGERSLQQAKTTYDQLGATPYLDRLSTVGAAQPARPPAPGVVLSERELEVLTLLVSGMSYVQISRELFVTRSTIGFHLGNIYAKAGVSSRHVLSDLARKNPQLFGISVRPE